MRKNLLLLFISTVCMINIYAIDVYVSPQGSDSNSGTIDAPFKTIQRAVNSIVGNGAGSVIWLREGHHLVTQPIEMGEQHSGLQDNPLRISAYPGEQAIITEGCIIPKSKFIKLGREDYLARLNPVARGQVYVAPLTEEKFSGLFPGKDKYNKTALVSWAGYVLNEAQFPNRGYAYISEILEKGPTTRWLQPGEDPEPYSENNPSGGKFKIQEQLEWGMMRSEFSKNKDMLIDGYFSNDWYFQNERIGDIASDGTIQLLRYTRYGIEDNIQLPRRVRIIGALCQLDEPGEWYYDKREKLFYIWPVKPLSDNKPITIAGSSKIFTSDGIAHVKFERLIFENFGDHGIKFMNSHHISVLGCEFRSSNGLAVRIIGTDNLVKSCDFHDLLKSIVLGSSNPENRKNLVNENNAVINCHIYNCWLRGYGAMAIESVGSRFANNLIHNMNGALIYGNNDCVVEYNEMYDMGFEMGDWNPMYRGADFSAYGNEIRFNFFHHLMETPKCYPVAAARNDDYGHGTKFHHNIAYKSGRGVCSFQGAMNCMSDNVIMETKFVWTTMQIPYVSLPKSDWLTKGDFLTTRYQTYLDNQDKVASGEMHVTEKHNYLGRAELIFGKKGWENNQLWLDKYPFMSEVYNFDDIDRNPWMQCYDTIANNYASGVLKFPFHVHGPNAINNIDDMRLWMPKSGLFEMPHIINPNDLFVKPDSLDFSFKPGMSISGLSNFDFFDNVGLFVDEYRTQVPDKKAYRKAIADKYKGQASSGGTLNLELLNKRYNDPFYLTEETTGIKKIVSESQKFFSLSLINSELKLIFKTHTELNSVSIYSITGKCLYMDYNFDESETIDVSSYGTGMYIVRVATGDKIQAEKFIKQ